jgi:hypothetical protein
MNQNTQHTPGPWIAEGDDFIAHIYTATGKMVNPHHPANARLIASAPETAAERDSLKALNAELLEAVRAYKRTADDNGVNSLFLNIQKYVDFVLAKAEGRA